MSENKRYEAIDGLRAFSAIGIVMMHVLSNGKYKLDGFVFRELIPSFTNLVFLFMMISSFSMCCGYFEKIIYNQVSVETFYKKRYARIWPYFALLCFLDLCLSPSLHALYEVFANLTLCFGLLPNANIEVIGVGWFLGLIFVFYLLFPFFCFLLSNKRRAWFAFFIAFLFHILCEKYFVEVSRSNIVYSAVYLMAGGVIFLYRKTLSQFSNRFPQLVLGLCAVVTAASFLVEGTAVKLLLYSLLLVWAIGVKKRGVLVNPITKFVSGISMEIYLCHMVIYRVLEKLNFLHLFSNEMLSYAVATAGTVIGASVFALVMQRLLVQWKNLIKKKE